MTFDEIKKLSMEASEHRNELLNSIRNMHDDMINWLKVNEGFE